MIRAVPAGLLVELDPFARFLMMHYEKWMHSLQMTHKVPFFGGGV